jgi:hypothetical protein
MRRLLTLAIAILTLGVPSATRAKNQDRTKDVPKRFPIRLLPGYKATVGYGIDTWGAKIGRDGGITIEFIQGLHVEVEADSFGENDVAWREQQVVNGQQAICVYTKSNDFVVSIPKLAVNFRAHIRNQQDLAEMLLMVLTYEPTHGYPFAPGAVAFPRPDEPR